MVPRIRIPDDFTVPETPNLDRLLICGPSSCVVDDCAFWSLCALAFALILNAI